MGQNHWRLSMARLVGFRLNRNFPLSPSFYCLDCMEALSREKGWHWKDGRSRKGAAPIIAHGDGLVTYLKGSASSMRLQMKDGEWVMRDEKLNEAEEASLSFYMSSLGLRISSLAHQAHLALYCRDCGVSVLQAPAQPLSIYGQRATT